MRFGFASGAGEGGSTAGIEVPVLRAGFLATGGAPLPPLRKCKIFKDVLQVTHRMAVSVCVCSWLS